MLFRALVAGYAAREGFRTLVTVFAVALGVAIALAIQLANATAVASFAQSVNLVASSVNLQIVAIGNGFDESVFPRVRRVAGIRDAQAAIEDSLAIGVKPGDPASGEILHILGIDLLQPSPKAADARGGLPGAYGAGRNGSDPYVLVGERGALVSDRVAQRYGLRVGKTFEALAGDRDVRLKAAAVFSPRSAALDSSVVLVDIVTAQELFGKVGTLDRIDLTVDPHQLGAVKARLAPLVPHGARVVEPAVRTGEIRRMLRSFQMNLAALAYVALLVGAYLIYNAVGISVVQRRAEIGTLRALGATRDEILGTFLAEGAALGALGSACGVALGALLARFAVGAVSRTVDTLYVGTHVDGVVYDPVTIGGAFLAGVLLAVGSSLAPALEAAGTLPASAMRSRGYERRDASGGGNLAFAGCALLALCALASRLGPVGGVPIFGYGAALAAIFGVSLCVPAIVVGASRLARVLARNAPAAARIAAANFGAMPRRSSVAVASLAVATAMMVAIAVLIGSFRTTVVAWADESLRADLFIRPPGIADASSRSRFTPELVARLRSVSGVAAVDAFRSISVPFRGSLTTLGATDFRTLAVRRKLRFLDGADPGTLARTLPNSNGALVSEPFATRFEVKEGDALTFETPSGPTLFRVAAIYNDYSSDAGVAILDARTYARLYRDPTFDALAVYAGPRMDLAGLRTRLIRAALPSRIELQSNRELRDLVIRIFDRTFAITYALYLISIAIAVLGVVSTLFALVIERRREIGILRYVGATVGVVRGAILYEAALIGALGAAVGLALGMVLALLLIFVINRQAFGWLIELHVPYAFLVEAAVLVTLAAIAAGLYPAGVAARIATADAVRDE
ncbi:MAG: FtsX-like permease family protein [Candidatus Eremiobacteraeota bacterium]|nr:FtsX-like permease family protein [Candidatus Eremiobacteraeota bacterium]